MDKEKLTWRSFADDGSIVGTWNLPGTPTFYVIDHQRVIRHKWVGSPAEYKLGGLPDAKAIDAALDHGLSQGLIESTNTKIRLLTRIAFGFRSPEALIALAMLALGGHRPALPGRTKHPRISQ